MSQVVKVLAALDVGGTTMGYSYKDLRNYAKEVQFPEWGPHKGNKTRSCVLLTPNRHFHSLGYEAERKFAELQKTGESPAWFYCQNVKRILTDKQDYVKCHNRQTVPVMEIMTSILHYFSSHLLDTCREGPEDDSIGPHNVRWVINLPMKSRDNIVTLLKVAATKAGIDRSTLYFIPEVESILAIAKNLHKENVNESDGNWCLCDIGGSSVRVAKVELDTAEGKVSDVDIENVNGVGGHLLDDRFLVLLRNIFGSHIIQAFEDYLPVPMLDFMRNFELTKSNMSPEFSKKYVFYLHAALIKKYKFLVPSFRGKDAFAPNPRYGDKVTMTDHNLVADETIVWFFLKEAVDKVIEFLQSAFEKLQIDSNTAIIVTGGYSQYWKLRDVMRQKFSKRHVMYMDSPAETALIGALRVLKGIEAKKTFESLPFEIQQMSIEERNVFCEALQRGQFAESDVKINVIGHVGSSPKSMIRSFVMGVGHETKRTKEDLRIFLGRRKHQVKNKNKNGLVNSFTTFILPLPYSWKSLYMNGKDILNSNNDKKLLWSTESYQAIYRSHHQLLSPRRKRVEEEFPEIPDYESTPTPRDLGVPHDQNVDQLHSVHIRELGSESDVFQGRQSLLDRRPIYMLLYSLEKIITDTVQDSTNGPGTRQSSLLDFLTNWIKMIYTFTKNKEEEHPQIVLFGTHHREQKETFVRSRSETMIKQLDKYFTGSPLRDWLTLDPLLRGNVENERDLGLERLRQTLMDIAINHKTTEWFPRHWVAFFDRMMAKRREGQKVMSSNMLRKCNAENLEPLENHEIEVFLKYHVSIGNFLDFSHVDLHNYIFLDPNVIGDELNVIFNLEKNSKPTKTSPYREAVVQKSTLQQYLAMDKVKGHGQVTQRALMDLGLLVKPTLYDSHGNVLDPSYFILPGSLPNHNTTALREKLFAEKKCITMRFRSEGCFPLSVFQRLLSAVLSVWPNVNYFAKPLLAANVGAFSLDSFHRLVLALHEETIDVYIYHQTASFHVNPSVLRNIRHFLELNLTRILCVTSSRKHTTKFEHTIADGVISIDTNEKSETEIYIKDDIFITEVATCNSFTPCFVSVETLKEEENWKCEKHGVGGRSRDLFGIWYPVEETIPDPVHKGHCDPSCKGLREYLLTKTPSEQLVGRLARRLDPQVIPAVARKLGLTPGEIVRVRDQTAGVSPWHRSFHTLHSVIQKQSVTVGQLQEALVSEGVGPHVLCQGFRIYHETEEIPRDFLERSVSKRELAAIALNINKDVFPLAVELDVPSHEALAILQKPVERDPTSNIRELLTQWYLYSEFKPTFRVLVTAFLEVGFDLVCATNALDQSNSNELF